MCASTGRHCLKCLNVPTSPSQLVDGVQPPMFVPNKRPGKASDIPPQSLFDAIATVRSMYAQKNATSSSRIQQGFDLGIRLGIDPKRGDHNVRESGS